MTKTNLKTYLETAISYHKYIENEKARVNTTEEFNYKEYHVINLQRMERIGKQAKSNQLWSQDELSKLESNEFKILAITEGWCGDAAQIIPWINALAENSENKLSFGLVYRDENEDLMKEYLTNGGMAIPVIIIADYEGNYLSHFAPRPTEAQRLMLSEKENGADKDAISLALQKWYNQNKGEAIIKEVKQMILNATFVNH